MEEVRAVEHTHPCGRFFMKHRYRNRRVLAVAALVAAIAIALPRFLTHAPYQRLGVRLDWSEKVARVADVIGPPGQGLLQKGDRLIAVEGRPITLEGAMARLRQKTPGFPAEPFELLIERRGVPMSLTVPPLHLNVWQRVAPTRCRWSRWWRRRWSRSCSCGAGPTSIPPGCSCGSRCCKPWARSGISSASRSSRSAGR